MTKYCSMALASGAALALSLATASDANAWFGRSNGSCGSNGGSYSSSSHGSGGSFGGLFSRRSNNCYTECHTESYSSCGSHGGTYNGIKTEVHGEGSNSDGPPQAPVDPGGVRSDGAAAVTPPSTMVADRNQSALLVASNRRFSRIFR